MKLTNYLLVIIISLSFMWDTMMLLLYPIIGLIGLILTYLLFYFWINKLEERMF